MNEERKALGECMLSIGRRARKDELPGGKLPARAATDNPLTCSSKRTMRMFAHSPGFCVAIAHRCADLHYYDCAPLRRMAF